MNRFLKKFTWTPALAEVLEECKGVSVPTTKQELYEMVFGTGRSGKYDVVYDVSGRGEVCEATIVRAKNGVVVNYPEDYMRRRDPDCMRIGDDKPTDKPRFSDVYGYDFEQCKQETYEWLKTQELIVMPFNAGGNKYGYGSMLICPRNAAFFAYAMANLQGFVSAETSEGFAPRSIVYVAPPFRHTHFNGRQVVVHNRLDDCHEVFAYNLYPGPSAKKGVYSVLLDIGEHEDWVTAHASCGRLVTQYDNELVIMHEGASGGGKSEMLQDIARNEDGSVLLSTNTITGEKTMLQIGNTSHIEPVCDDMATCYPSLQNNSGKLVLVDGEDGWFLRMDGVTHYGCDPIYERICTEPDEPLVFFNIQGVVGATSLIWEHSLDSNGKPCPNPRAIVPRSKVPHIVDEPVEVDIRSFGTRMPPSTSENPNYGIMGMMHFIPPALAWMWRLVAPRGFKNPSIVGGGELKSEGVGSYWPFATGLRVKQANLLLEQIINCPNTRYVLIPNQHIGVYRVGFAAEWISREWLARHNGHIKMDKLEPARCPLLGYALKEMVIEGHPIRSKYLRTETQDRLGKEGYDAGAKILNDFFAKELDKFYTDDLDPLGRQIIECFRNGGTIEDYCKITPIKL
ncbi:MAG: DUF4914 family protein [Butyricicoccus pullicaecorum]|nr:DUF4914 family protein [Butyricicoccus pullicaecorum]